MIALGMGLIWAGYALGLWGYILLRGYNVSFPEVLSPSYPARLAGGGTARGIGVA